MSHAIDIDGIHEKLFVLRNVVFASIPYANEERLASDIDHGHGFFDGYWGQLKVLLSNYIIETSVKMRMIQEFCGEDEDIGAYEAEALDGGVIGTIHKGKFNLTLRESLNKIIHSTHATIEFSESPTNGFKHWDGNYHLHGTHQSKPWHLELAVANGLKQSLLI